MQDIADWEIDKTEDPPEEEPSASSRFEILNYPADLTLSGYLELDKNKQIKKPEFQRDFVWDQTRASRSNSRK